MASESLFSVKRMLKEIKEKLSVSSGGSGGTELTLGEVVEELKSTIETVNTTVTEIKQGGSGFPKHTGILYLVNSGEIKSSDSIHSIFLTNFYGYLYVPYGSISHDLYLNNDNVTPQETILSNALKISFDGTSNQSLYANGHFSNTLYNYKVPIAGSVQIKSRTGANANNTFRFMIESFSDEPPILSKFNYYDNEVTYLDLRGVVNE